MAQLLQNMVFAGRYNLQHLLGRGGSSEVWLADDQLSGVKVALKVYAVDTVIDSAGEEMLRKEFSLVFNMNHPNLLRPTHYDI
ncbi:MAG: serine/threonine protein kinase, partial [Tannerellaceae bacterium]|nr:serine/threonine protein kinase [Tannerellaceae bacterium]